MTDRDQECARCGLSGSARWLVTHGHRRWSSWLLPWLGDFSGLVTPWRLDGKRLWEPAAGKHRRQAREDNAPGLFRLASPRRRLRGTTAGGAWCAMRTMQTMYRYSDETVARACWAVLDIMNDKQGPPWADVPFGPFGALSEPEQGLVIEGVRAARRGATPRELFGLWAARKRELGWTWGAIKDEALKTHPNLVAYDDLTAAQRDKDKVFQAVVTAMTDVTPALSGPSAFAARRDGDTMEDPLQCGMPGVMSPPVLAHARDRAGRCRS